MHAQLITYELKDIDHEAHQKTMVADAAVIALMPGLVSKVWLDLTGSNKRGGFYVWQSPESMRAFMASAFARELMARPFLTNFLSADWQVPEAASKTTRGVPL